MNDTTKTLVLSTTAQGVLRFFHDHTDEDVTLVADALQLADESPQTDVPAAPAYVVTRVNKADDDPNLVKGVYDVHRVYPATPRDGTTAAATAAFDSRTKLAHSKVSRVAIVKALDKLNLRIPGYSFEATANALIDELPVHDGCIATHLWFYGRKDLRGDETR